MVDPLTPPPDAPDEPGKSEAPDGQEIPDTPEASRSPDTRRAALWATAFAVPITLLVGLLLFWRLSTQTEALAVPSPSTSPPAAAPTGPVHMAAPRLSAHAAQACRTLTAQLPTRVRDLPARKVSAGPEQNAAYGEPPITVACGVAQPTRCAQVTGGRPGCVPLGAQLYVMNGVCWFPLDGPATKVFTTMDREVAVEVSVPASYQQAAQWANEFSDTVAHAAKPRATDFPTACGR